SDWLRETDRILATDETERLVAKRGAFHVARIAAFRWRGSDNWEMKSEILKQQLNELETTPFVEEVHFANAFQTLIEVIKSSSTYSADVDRAFKSTALDRHIDRFLYEVPNQS